MQEVFPLPDTVLFPGVVLPLHIVEPRYRDLVADALATHRHMVLVMVEPGQASLVTPPLCEVGCAARIIHAETLERGRYNILLQGVDRVRLRRELPSGRAYRCFATELIARPCAATVKGAQQELARLQSCVFSLGHAAAESDRELVEVLRSTACPVELADILAAVLVREPGRQQTLLATAELRRRLGSLLEYLAEALLRYGAPSASAKSN
ncbi:MAG: ATP-dependent protease [Deltaproteobacteria bacterium]|nr:MAG: ATP-dependent protease [Deltaproteobacteria bacterium]